MPKSYLTPNQVAELLMVTPTAVRQWSKKGELHALLTPGGHRRFLPTDVECFARQRGLTLNSKKKGEVRVLIVDDNEPFSQYLQQLLQGFSTQMITEIAHDGFVAGLKIQEFKPEFILLDLMMPGLNGFEVCRLLKVRPNTKSIRVIAMTGYPSAKNINKILLAGAQHCLSKPIDEQSLFKQLGLSDKEKTSRA